MTQNQKILAILHQAHSRLGHVEPVLTELGYDIIKCRPLCGDPLPKSVTDYAGVVIFGGPMGANDEPMKPELEWLAIPLRENIPFLGICLGAQLLIKHIGGEVRTDPKNRVEVGYHRITPTPEGERLMTWPSHVYQWHKDAMFPPKSVSVLATGPQHFHCQAFVLNGITAGVQFHPDVDFGLLERWCAYGALMDNNHGVEPVDLQRAHYHRYNKPLNDWFKAFVSLWLKGELMPPPKKA